MLLEVYVLASTFMRVGGKEHVGHFLILLESHLLLYQPSADLSKPNSNTRLLLKENQTPWPFSRGFVSSGWGVPTPLRICVTLGRLPSLSVPRLSSLEGGNRSSRRGAVVNESD